MSEWFLPGIVLLQHSKRVLSLSLVIDDAHGRGRWMLKTVTLDNIIFINKVYIYYANILTLIYNSLSQLSGPLCILLRIKATSSIIALTVQYYLYCLSRYGWVLLIGRREVGVCDRSRRLSYLKLRELREKWVWRTIPISIVSFTRQHARLLFQHYAQL